MRSGLRFRKEKQNKDPRYKGQGSREDRMLKNAEKNYRTYKSATQQKINRVAVADNINTIIN